MLLMVYNCIIMVYLFLGYTNSVHWDEMLQKFAIVQVSDYNAILRESSGLLRVCLKRDGPTRITGVRSTEYRR